MLQQQGFTCIEVDLNPPQPELGGKSAGTGEELMDHFVDRTFPSLLLSLVYA